MEKEILKDEELEKTKTVKKIFKEIYFDDFEDPCEDFTEVKLKHGKFYSVEKIRTK